MTIRNVTHGGLTMKHLIALSLLTASTAFARGSSHPKAQGPEPISFIKFEDAPRIVMFDSRRNWYTADGILLICPFDAEADHKQNCTRGKADAWMPATSYNIPGHTMIGYQHIYTGSSGARQLHLYFRLTPTGAEPKVNIVQTDVVNLAGPVTFTGTVNTLNAAKVIIQRRRGR